MHEKLRDTSLAYFKQDISFFSDILPKLQKRPNHHSVVMDNDDSIGGSTTSDDENYLSFTQDDQMLPEEALTNQEYYEQRMAGLKSKMAEQRMEFRVARKRMKRRHEEEVHLLNNKMEIMKELVECPVCLQAPRSGPIYVCPNGHFVFKDCKLRNCSTCRTQMGQGKSLLAVTVIENIEHPCKYDSCPHRFNLTSLPTHEKYCPHRTVSCPDGDCRSKVPLAKLVSHLSQSECCCADAAPTQVQSGADWVRKNYVIDDVANADEGWPMSLYSFDDQAFAVIPSKSNGQYFFVLVMFAPKSECIKYEVEIVAHQWETEATASEFSFKFSGNPTSIDVKKEELAFFGISEKCMKAVLDEGDEPYGPSFNLSFKISKK